MVKMVTFHETRKRCRVQEISWGCLDFFSDMISGTIEVKVFLQGGIEPVRLEDVAAEKSD